MLNVFKGDLPVFRISCVSILWIRTMSPAAI